MYRPKFLSLVTRSSRPVSTKRIPEIFVPHVGLLRLQSGGICQKLAPVENSRQQSNGDEWRPVVLRVIATEADVFQREKMIDVSSLFSVLRQQSRQLLRQ